MGLERFNHADRYVDWEIEGKSIVVLPNYVKHVNGLPKEERFDTFMFKCYYESDTEKFEELIRELGGQVYGVINVPSLNRWNKPVSLSYVVVYQYKEELEMEVLC